MLMKSFLKIKKFFKTNNAGGTLGGITSGQEIIVKFAVKPTSSILKKRQTIDANKKQTSIITKVDTIRVLE